MKKFKRLLRQNKTLVNVIIVLIGIVLIVVSPWLKSPYAQTIFSGIGTSFLASGVVVLITLVLTDNTEGQENLSKWGLEAIYLTRGEMNVSCDQYLKKCRKLDIIAFGLRSFRDSQEKVIEKILKSGGVIRILTMDPDCDNLKQREKDEKQEEGSIKLTIEQLISWANRLNSRNYSGRIEIRCYDAQPLDFMFLMNNRLFIGPYEYGKGSQQTISYEFNVEGETYRYYLDYFNKLWEDSTFAKNALEK